MRRKQLNEWLWDAWCCASVIGIWPRFIEPNLLSVNKLTLTLPSFSPALKGLKFLHFSDLHWDSHFSSSFAKRITSAINAMTPDFIFFTGDFICRAKLENGAGLKDFLNSLKARIGCYAVLGNHDYQEFVTVNPQGDYDVETPSKTSVIKKGFKRLFQAPTLTRQVTRRAASVKKHRELLELLADTPFQVLNNETKVVACDGQWINICGLEEYSLGKCLPSLAFKNYNNTYPGIILSHNPDTFAILQNYPGDLILSGHTHGGQVNLPWLWKRFTLLENVKLKGGLKQIGKKLGYINRGLSSIMKFRWFAPPELTLLTLK